MNLAMRSIYKFIAVSLITLICWLGIVPYVLNISSTHAEQITQTNIREIDLYLAKAIKSAYQNTEEYATEELDLWVDKQMQKVDQDFLPWYFGFFNQKFMEFGIPFAWATFGLDSWLKVFRREDEKSLSADEVIQKRMIEDFSNKFKELVFNDESGEDLQLIINGIGRNYASAVGFQFAKIKAKYKIPDQDWEKHLDQISQLIYDTGNNTTSLSPKNLTMNSLTKVRNVTTSIIGAKVAIKLVSKIAPKVLAKGGSAMLFKVGSQFVEPAILVGLLAWDYWDYQKMVASSQPELRKNIFDYFQELKASLLDNTDNGIMAAIGEVEEQILNSLEYQQS